MIDLITSTASQAIDLAYAYPEWSILALMFGGIWAIGKFD